MLTSSNKLIIYLALRPKFKSALNVNGERLDRKTEENKTRRKKKAKEDG
jgi:hypothetical protein